MVHGRSHVPLRLAHARIVERRGADREFVTFHNPAGLIAHGAHLHTRLRVIGICDTPVELFIRSPKR